MLAAKAAEAAEVAEAAAEHTWLTTQTTPVRSPPDCCKLATTWNPTLGGPAILAPPAVPVFEVCGTDIPVGQ